MVLRNWHEFLRLHSNKKELFLFVPEQVVRTAIEGKQIIVIRGEEVLFYPPATRRNELSPCSPEKVDTRMIVHIADAVQDGHQSVMIRSTDTDVVVLVACYNFRLKGIMGVLWNQKKPQDPTGTSLCKGSWSI